MQDKLIRAAVVVALAGALHGTGALAQVGTQVPAPAPSARVETLDRIVAVVNDEVITKYEMEEQKRLVVAQLNRQGTALPAPDVPEKQLLERLINERAQLQWGKDTGIRIDDAQVERTIARIAEDNKLTQAQFRDMLKQDNIPYSKFREDMRNEMMLARVREREVDNKIVVSEAEIDNYLATQVTQSGNQQEYRIAHILVLLPEQANAEQINARRARAEDALKQLKEGKDFAQVAAGYSDASDALQGGNLGWRAHGRLPTIFADAVPSLKPGENSGILKSPNGFHIVKVLEVRAIGGKTVVDQTHARHILIKVSEIVSEADAKARIDRINELRLRCPRSSGSKWGSTWGLTPKTTISAKSTACGVLA